MKAIYCHGGSPHDKATPLAFTLQAPKSWVSELSFKLSFVSARKYFVFVLTYFLSYFFREPKPPGDDDIIPFWSKFESTFQWIYSHLFHLFLQTLFFVSFSTTLAIYTVNYSLFHMLVNIMKNMNVIKKNYFYKYANLFWVK